MSWIARALFPWLLKRAMKMGAKEFASIDAKKHGVQSRDYMARKHYVPLFNKIRESPSKIDDPLIDFIYYNQAVALSDGTAHKILVSIKAEAASVNRPDTIINYANTLERVLGLDV